MVMEKIEVPLLQQALDVVESLPPGDQETLIDLIRHRLVERRRAEIARNAQETLQAVRDGRAQYGSVEDLRLDLLGEPCSSWLGGPASAEPSSDMPATTWLSRNGSFFVNYPPQVLPPPACPQPVTVSIWFGNWPKL